MCVDDITYLCIIKCGIIRFGENLLFVQALKPAVRTNLKENDII